MRRKVEKLCLEEVVLRFVGEDGSVILATLIASPSNNGEGWDFYIGSFDSCMCENLENIEQLLKIAKERRDALEKVLQELKKIVES